MHPSSANAPGQRKRTHSETTLTLEVGACHSHLVVLRVVLDLRLGRCALAALALAWQGQPEMPIC